MIVYFSVDSYMSQDCGWSNLGFANLNFLWKCRKNDKKVLITAQYNQFFLIEDHTWLVENAKICHYYMKQNANPYTYIHTYGRYIDRFKSYQW